MYAKVKGFNPKRDKVAVEPFGSIDLKNAFVTGVIPSTLPETDELYNGIEDPCSILGKPTDVFEAIAMESQINSYQSPDKDKSAE